VPERLGLGLGQKKSDLTGGKKHKCFGWVLLSQMNKASPTTPTLKPKNMGKNRINMSPLTNLIQICFDCSFVKTQNIKHIAV
jgi:hypothetical protein